MGLISHQEVMSGHGAVPPAAVDPLRARRRWLARLRAAYGRPVAGPETADEGALLDELLEALAGVDRLDPAVPRPGRRRAEGGRRW
jgi:hypothetical protein